jgi:hypothetical protein
VPTESEPDALSKQATGADFDVSDIEKMLSAIRKLDTRWKEPKRPLGLAPADWRPNLVSGKRVCHVHAVSVLRDHWTGRMAAAQKAGRQITIAAPLSSWYVNETLLAADKLDAEGVVLRPSAKGWQAKSYESIGELIATENLIVNPDVLRPIARRALARARKATARHARGRLFEKLLCLVFSQVPDFELYAHNYRTETEEIDAVFVNRRAHGRCWSNSPLVLLSGKNVKGGAGAPAVTSLASKMRNRREMCKLGFLCSAGTISQDARNHELRYSREDCLMVLVDGKHLDSLLDKADQLEAELEKLVIEASLA